MNIRFEQPFVPADQPDTIKRLFRDVDWAAVPAVGDYVLWGDGPVAGKVDRIFWEPDGRPLVHLHGNMKAGPTLSDAELRSLRSQGWALEHRAAHFSHIADGMGEDPVVTNGPAPSA
jgi:hypothetical protein